MSKSMERRLSVQWRAKAEQLEADLAAAQEQLARIAAAMSTDEGETLRYDRHFEWVVQEIDQALSAAPAGQVLWEDVGFVAHLPDGNSIWHSAGGQATLDILGEQVGKGDQLAKLTMREQRP